MVLPHLDDVKRAAAFASKSTRVMGITTELLFVFMANIEARQQLIAYSPAAIVLLVDSACGTND